MARILLRAAVFVLSACAALQPQLAAAQSPHTHQHSFGDAEKWARKILNPPTLLDKLGLPAERLGDSDGRVRELSDV